MMPSARRLRLLLMVALGAVITTLFFTSQFRSSADQDSRTIQDFYHKTVNAMDPKKGGSGGQVIMDGKHVVKTQAKDTDADGDIDEDDAELAKAMSERLRAAEQKAKDLANAKAPLKPDPPSEVVGIGSSADGQFKKGKGKTAEEDKRTEPEAEVDPIEGILSDIFKKSPMIIFSKSYCPYSKKAKGLLLEKYSIDPAPYVVELDEHPQGPALQARLAEMTGRKTVPNIIINGKSIGGSDDIAELDNRKTLIDTVKSVSGKKISMKERFVDGPKGL